MDAAGVGDFFLRVTATDLTGLNPQSVQIPIHVITSNSQPPTSLLLSGLDGRSFAAGSSLPLVALTTDASGAPLQNVQFFVDGVAVPAASGPVTGGRGGLHRQDSSTVPFSQSLAALGDLIKDELLTVQTTDASGVTTVSAGATVHVTAARSAATFSCAITSPAGGGALAAAAPVYASVAAVKSSGAVRQVELFANQQRVGVATTAPFTFNVPPLGVVGSFALTAIATDDQGISAASPPVIVTTFVPVVTATATGDATAITGGEKGKILISRTGDTSLPLTVAYQAKGKAINGVDYESLPGAVVIPAGAASAKVKIKALPNPAAADATKARIKLTLPADNSYTLGSPSKAKITILKHS